MVKLLKNSIANMSLMALVAIVAIVGIVGLIFMNYSSTGNVFSGDSSNLGGNAIITKQVAIVDPIIGYGDIPVIDDPVSNPDLADCGVCCCVGTEAINDYLVSQGINVYGADLMGVKEECSSLVSDLHNSTGNYVQSFLVQALNQRECDALCTGSSVDLSANPNMLHLASGSIIPLDTSTNIFLNPKECENPQSNPEPTGNEPCISCCCGPDGDISVSSSQEDCVKQGNNFHFLTMVGSSCENVCTSQIAQSLTNNFYVQDGC